MKNIKFAPALVPLVLSGEKNITWRLFDDKDLSVGDDLEFINGDSGEVFGHAKILKVWEKKLGEVGDEDYDGHEKFVSKEVMLETYRGYYGKRVSGETLVKVITFLFNSSK
ncbi:MAG: ASCH domain-containing protein [bacterium]